MELNGRLDRRVRYTRMVIRESFIGLLARKPMSKITVKEICAAADVNRATFYAHYADQYALLGAIEADVLRALNEYVRDEIYRGEPGEITLAMFRKMLTYIFENADVIKTLLNTNTEDLNFQHIIIQMFGEQFVAARQGGAVSAEQAEFIFRFVAFGAIGVIRCWLDTGCRQPPAELAELLQNLTFQGMIPYK
ncbi:MAG: TetR family transcriptional regulator C-terminal domain-containing protein [Oscillospiraceae bacterium]|nr:TetR family transcriptional regulator C-terminal domain-containing protein [Oscillospiraceae bacterium]